MFGMCMSFFFLSDGSFDMYSKIINRYEFLKRDTEKERGECERKRKRVHQLSFKESLVKSSHDFQYIYNNATQYCYSKTKN